MKILHITTNLNGGAGIAAIRLHLSMLKYGIDSKLLTLNNNGKNVICKVLFDGEIHSSNIEYPLLTFKNLIHEKITKSYSNKILYNKIKKNEKLKLITPSKINNEFNFTLFSYPETIYDITTCSSFEDADVIHLHWVANFLDYPTFFSKINKPIVWTLHDENPYLGGFHYQDDVDNNMATHWIKESEFRVLKERSVSKCKKLTIVSPSNWIANNAEKSTIFKNRRVTVIRNCLNSNVFCPRDKKFSRELFNIPKDKIIVLIASHDLTIPRKGVSLISNLINNSEFSNFHFVFAGDNSFFSGSNIQSVGAIDDEILMSCLYSSADFFLLPSLLDNLPNTLLESLYCGTPVIAFNIGDFEDIFMRRDIGILVNSDDELDLFNAFRLINQGNYVFDRNIVSKKSLNLFSEYKTVHDYMFEYELLFK